MTVPLQTNEHGVIRVGNTHVLIESIIHAYYMGETPEGIVESYPRLTTADVYAVIGYYLANREEADDPVMLECAAKAGRVLLTHDVDLHPISCFLLLKLMDLRIVPV